jgi:hypothetical protein
LPSASRDLAVAIRRYLGVDMGAAAVEESKVKLGSIDMEEQEEEGGRGNEELSISFRSSAAGPERRAILGSV